MIRTKYDAVSFIIRTIILLLLVLFSMRWINDAKGDNGYKITDITGDKVTVSVGILRQQFTTPYADSLTVGDYFPAVDKLKETGKITTVVLYSVFSVLMIWDILIYFKVGKYIRRAYYMKKGIKQSATITGYANFQPFTYTIQVDEKYRVDSLILKSEQKKYPVGTPVLMYHLGDKKYWIELKRS